MSNNHSTVIKRRRCKAVQSSSVQFSPVLMIFIAETARALYKGGVNNSTCMTDAIDGEFQDADRQSSRATSREVGSVNEVFIVQRM